MHDAGATWFSMRLQHMLLENRTLSPYTGYTRGYLTSFVAQSPNRAADLLPLQALARVA